ncbi:glycosyltransferase [Polaribacter sp.]|uniref:glycosyltransferase n=1 Tax=Polaribacter sp. TaxID=1920175 RepID=UPI0025EFC2B7|nr:glycosyltransferase [Polaribacter sp.]
MISASIVLYNTNLETLQNTVYSFLKTPIPKKLYLIDNSKTSKLKKHFLHKEIEYIFLGQNIGFGSAHNLVLHKLTSEFHLILNPDVEFSGHVIPSLIKKLKTTENTSFISPKVLNSDKTLQYVCRKHPTFLNLLNRKLKFSKKQIEKNQYQHKDVNEAFNPEFIHGCFMLFKTKYFKKLKGFDERYFLYLEDADLCRKIEIQSQKILYFPDVHIVHQHQKGSSKKIKLFFYHVSSAIRYFLKWGFR